MELVVGILCASAIANIALLGWMSRASHVRLHWPQRLTSAFMLLAPRGESEPRPVVRRRSLYAPDRMFSLDRPIYRTSAAPPAAKIPLAETLPPDLAEFLARPAPMQSAGHDGNDHDGRGYDGHDGRSAAGSAGPAAPTILTRYAAPAGRGTAEPALGPDQLTGLEGAGGWNRIVEIENARLLRYRRPVTIVLADLEGLRRLAERLGEEPVERLLPVVADAFRREARSSDWVARIGESRFAALLAETDEIQAINYVERIRLVCEPWLASAAVPLRLAIGWSGPTASSDLEFAIARAEERMHGDRRLPGKIPALPRVMAGTAVSIPAVAGVSGPPAPSPASVTVGSPGAVSPAETGRFGSERAVIGANSTAAADPASPARGKGRRRPQGPLSASDGGQRA